MMKWTDDIVKHVVATTGKARKRPTSRNGAKVKANDDDNVSLKILYFIDVFFRSNIGYIYCIV